MAQSIVDEYTTLSSSSSSSSSCGDWFERNVLCDSINDSIEWSMNFNERDVTLCPARCQTCKNYNYDANNTNTNDSAELLFDEYGNSYEEHQFYFDEYDYCYNRDGDPLYDANGNHASMAMSFSSSSVPWEMQDFYEHVHCALDFEKLPNIWKTGDSDEMYERIVRRFHQYSPTVLSRPEDSEYARSSTSSDSNPDVGVGPWLIQLEDFLTDDECDEMIRQTKTAIRDQQGEYSLEAGGDEVNEMGGVCQSTQAWCDPVDCMNQPILRNTWKKMEELVGIPFHTHTEPVHFIRYVPGQKYGSHTDSIPNEYKSMTGPRLFTLLFYLNDIEDGNGGQTCFPKIPRARSYNSTSIDNTNSTTVVAEEEPICIQPKKGRAVIWPNILNEIPNDRQELPDNRTWHEAHGITEGYKFAGTVWYHLRNYSYAEQVDCLHVYTEFEDYVDYYEEAAYYDEYNDDEYGYVTTSNGDYGEEATYDNEF